MIIRTLNKSEKELLRAALERLRSTTPVKKFHHWGADSMLRQDMVENLMWIQSKEEING